MEISEYVFRKKEELEIIHSLELDKEINEYILFEKPYTRREFDLFGERPTISIKKIGNDISGESIKAYNILNVNQREIRNAVLKITLQGVALFPIEKIVSGVASIILLILEFYELAKYDLTENTARTLYCIYLIDKKEFSMNEILDIYNHKFKEKLKSESISEILSHLEYLKCLKIDNKSMLITMEEDIKIIRA